MKDIIAELRIYFYNYHNERTNNGLDIDQILQNTVVALFPTKKEQDKLFYDLMGLDRVSKKHLIKRITKEFRRLWHG